MSVLSPDTGPVPVRVLRWAARAASVVSLGLLSAFAFSGGTWPTAFEWLLLAFFPAGVAAGMVLGWSRELLGGSIATGSVAAFHLLLLAGGERPAPGPWFLAFASPGIAFLVCGLWSARAGRG